MQQAYNSAVERNETMPIESAITQQVEARIGEARSGVLPQLNGIANYTRIDPPSSGSGTTSTDVNQHYAEIRGTQALFHGFREFDAVRGARANLRSQQAETESTQDNLFLQVAQSYYNVLLSEQDIRNLNEVLKLSQERLNELRTRVNTGRTRGTDLLSARSQEAILKSQLDAAVVAVAQARDTFFFVTRLPKDSKLVDLQGMPTTQRLQPLDIYLADVEKRPDVRSLIAQVEAAEANKSYQRGGYFPQLDAFGDYFFDRVGSGPKDSKWDVGLNLVVPLFEGGLISSQVGEAGALLRQRELVLAQARHNAETEIRNAYSAVEGAVAQIVALKDAVDTATAAYKALNRDYRNGLATNIDVLETLNAQLDAKRTFDRTRYQVEVSWVSLQNAIGANPQSVFK